MNSSNQQQSSFPAFPLLIVGATAAAATLMYRRRRHSFAGKNIVITGGSRGLGLEMARCWGEEGANIVICARDKTAVAKAVQSLLSRGINAAGTCCDVRKEDDCRAFADFARSVFGPIDVLVNNAGVIQVGPFDCMTQTDFEDAMATHLWGPLDLMSLVLPEMRRRGCGMIVNISSIGGRVSVPHLIPYCTSKFALVGLSEGLAAELAREGISVITVTPGLMRTGSPRNAEFKGRHRAEYAWFSIGDAVPGISVDSRTAARRIVEACRQRAPCPSVALTSYFASATHGLFAGAITTALGFVNRFMPTRGDAGIENWRGWQSESRWSPSWATALNEQAAVRNNEL